MFKCFPKEPMTFSCLKEVSLEEFCLIINVYLEFVKQIKHAVLSLLKSVMIARPSFWSIVL